MFRLVSLPRIPGKAGSICPMIHLKSSQPIVQVNFFNFSGSIDPSNNDSDAGETAEAAEAYPMSITYQKEILQAFQKQEEEKYLKEYEDELYQHSVKGVFPDVVNKKSLKKNFRKTRLITEMTTEEKINELNRTFMSSFHSSNRYHIQNEENVNEGYELMLAHKRLQCRMDRLLNVARKNKLMKMIRKNLVK